MHDDDAQALAFELVASRALVDGISAGIKARGFGDVRPAHGFAFARLAAGGATITELAGHLGVTLGKPPPSSWTSSKPADTSSGPSTPATPAPG